MHYLIRFCLHWVGVEGKLQNHGLQLLQHGLLLLVLTSATRGADVSMFALLSVCAAIGPLHELYLKLSDTARGSAVQLLLVQ